MVVKDGMREKPVIMTRLYTLQVSARYQLVKSGMALPEQIALVYACRVREPYRLITLWDQSDVSRPRYG